MVVNSNDTWNPTATGTFTTSVTTLGGLATSATEGAISSAYAGSIAERIMFHAALTSDQINALSDSQSGYFGTP